MAGHPFWRVAIALAIWVNFSNLSAAGESHRLRPLPELDRNVKTGPAVGEPIPRFEATDQHGEVRSFENLRGPKGLVLTFVRSADW
jgi:hypothetical protein